MTLKEKPRTDELFAAGDVIGPCYEVRRVLGAGGMGMVYEAHDRELNRGVAVKVSRPDIDMDWLVREARVMAAFNHPGLPAVYAMGTHGPVRYVAMELLRGRPLADHLQDTSAGYSVQEVRNLLLALAESVQVLHGANLVHRDIKPDNIMMVPPRRIVLVDFGITDMEQFVPGQKILGSPHYIAPEVVTGQVQVGHAHLVDIYALGVIGYQMLTGRPPFTGESITEILDKMVRQEAPRIAERRPGLPPALAGLVMEMLARNPLERPSSIDEVVTRLGAVAPDPDQPGQTAGAQVRLLIADDELEIWDFMAYVLEDQGFELVCVEDGTQALTRFEEQPFDIVIADKRMPNLNGLELLREIKSRRAATDVIIVSGFMSPEVEARARQLGVTRVLQKPFKIDALADLVYRLADKHRAHRAPARTTTLE